MNKLYFCISRINSLQKYGINSLLISKYCENLDLQTRFKTKLILEFRILWVEGTCILVP